LTQWLERAHAKFTKKPYSESIHALPRDSARTEFNSIIDSIDDTIRKLPDPNNSHRARRAKDLLLSGLKAGIDVVMVDADEATAFEDEGRSIYAFFQIETPESHMPTSLYLGIRTPPKDRADSLLEEAGHLAIYDIYKNEVNPYSSEQDPRKGRLESAIKEDVKSIKHKNKLLEDGGSFYSQDELVKEIPVKVLKQMAMGTWTNADAKQFPNITKYVENIMIPDFEYYRKNGELPVIKPLSQRR